MNPSQESLCISGSGSLHSWHQGTTEDLSDLTEDFSRLSLDMTEKGEMVETLEAVLTSENQKQDVQNIQQEDEATSDLNDEQENERDNDTETSLFKELAADEEIAGDTNKGEKSLATDETDCKDELGKTSEDETIETPQEPIRNESPEKTDHVPCPTSDLETPKKPVEQEARPTRTTPPPPKVLSAVARFQGHATIQGPNLKSRLKTLVEAGSSLSNREGQPEQTAEEEKDLSPVKVSELKKRFEAWIQCCLE